VSADAGSASGAGLARFSRNPATELRVMQVALANELYKAEVDRAGTAKAVEISKHLREHDAFADLKCAAPSGETIRDIVEDLTKNARANKSGVRAGCMREAVGGHHIGAHRAARPIRHRLALRRLAMAITL
jgi:hypothetical protein